MHFPKSICFSHVLFWVNHPFKPLVYCASEHQSSTRRQSQCRYLKKSAAADGSPHNEYTNTGTRLWVSYFIFHPLAFLFFFFFRGYQIRLGNVLLQDTYLLSGIWLCRCENDGVLWLLTLEMWFLALQCFTMALFQCFNLCPHVKTQQRCVGAYWIWSYSCVQGKKFHGHSVADFSECLYTGRGHCKVYLDIVQLSGSSHSVLYI